jgi:hypothetical protein
MKDREQFIIKEKKVGGDCGLVALEIGLSSLGIESDRRVLEKLSRFEPDIIRKGQVVHSGYGVDQRGMVEAAAHYASPSVLRGFGIDNLGACAKHLPVIVDYMDSDDMNNINLYEDGHYALLERVTPEKVIVFDQKGSHEYDKKDFIDRWWDMDRNTKGGISKGWAMVLERK